MCCAAFRAKLGAAGRLAAEQSWLEGPPALIRAYVDCLVDRYVRPLSIDLARPRSPISSLSGAHLQHRRPDEIKGAALMAVFERLIEIFKSGEARFRVIEHEPEGQSERVASVRGTTASQGAKAIVCRILVDGQDRLVLAIVPGNRRVDMNAVATAVGGRKGSFAPVAVAEAVTGCVMGAIPPVAFDDQL